MLHSQSLHSQIHSESLKTLNMNANDRDLIEKALQASGNAYAPYSGFAVGAAVRSRRGEVYLGSNLENAVYGLGICAEVVALAKANTAGDFDVEAIAIVGHKFTTPRDSSQVTTPCGRCRQLIAEASQISNTDVVVFSCSGDLEEIHESTISELLPESFGPKTLGVHIIWPEVSNQLREAVNDLTSLAITSND